MRRRRFLAAAAGAPAALSACKPKPPPAPPAAPAEPDGCQAARRDAKSGRVLTRAEWETLEAACERLLPKDEDPGAREAGVMNYIDAQLTHGPISSLRALLQTGAKELDRQSRGRPFSALTGDEQDGILLSLGRSQKGARFFQILLVLSLEGFFADPIYGGNRDEAGWKMIGFVPRSPRARCAYRGRS